MPRAEVHGAGVPNSWIGIHRAGVPHPAVPRREGMVTLLFSLRMISRRFDLL